jgi:hypothetical protein
MQTFISSSYLVTTMPVIFVSRLHVRVRHRPDAGTAQDYLPNQTCCQ